MPLLWVYCAIGFLCCLGWATYLFAPQTERVLWLTNTANPPPSFEVLKKTLQAEEGKSFFFSRPLIPDLASVEKIETHLKPLTKTKEYRIYFRKPFAWIRSEQGLLLIDASGALFPITERNLVEGTLPVLSQTPLAIVGLSSFSASRLAESWELQSLEVTGGGFLSVLKSKNSKRYLELRLSAARLENPGAIWLELETALQYFTCHQLQPRLLWMDIEGQVTAPGQMAWTKSSKIQ
jgi:hypothetical protein